MLILVLMLSSLFKIGSSNLLSYKLTVVYGVFCLKQSNTTINAVRYVRSSVDSDLFGHNPRFQESSDSSSESNGCICIKSWIVWNEVGHIYR